MTFRRALSSAFVPRSAWLLAAVCAVVVACKTDYQQGKEDPAFGLPNALAGQSQPGPSSDLSTGTGSSTGGTGGFLCVKNGGTLVDAGTCAVSFKTDILGAFKTSGCDSTICHGGANPPNQPKIDTTDPTTTWNGFAAMTLTTGTVYIDPCSTDATKSGIEANVDPKAPRTQGGTLMPSGSTTGLPQDVLTKLDTWLKCGSPDN